MSWSFKQISKTKDGAKKAIDTEAAKTHGLPAPVAELIKQSIDVLPELAGHAVQVETSGHLGAPGSGSYNSCSFRTDLVPLGE